MKDYIKFLEDLKSRVLNSRLNATRAVNTELILLYYHIGNEIILRQVQHGWGAKIIDRLSKDLRKTFPDIRGFSSRNLKYMRAFALCFPNLEFVQQLAAQLPWFHLVVLMDKIKDDSTRKYYIQKCLNHGWSRNMLVHNIESKIHLREGVAISNFPDKLMSPQSDLAVQTLKDPYIFDFLGVSDKANEKQLEDALIKHIEQFLLELGAGFAFVGRQYHLVIGNSDFYIDLLFYHTKLKCYVIIELKSGGFKPEYAGKLNFYLSAVDDVIKDSNDNPSIGLILCKAKDKVVAEYSLKDINKPIGLAAYELLESLPENLKTALPSIDDLEQELSKIK